MSGLIMNRKDSIVLTVVDIIDEHGIQGLSTKKIAQRQGVSEGTLFKHFRNKAEMITAALDHFAKFDNDISESTLTYIENGLSVQDAICFYTGAFATYYESYPAITAMLYIYDTLKHEPELSDKVTAIYNNRWQNLRTIIEEEQTRGHLRPDFDSEMMADIISGTFKTICLKWRMNNHTFSLRQRIALATNAIVNAFAVSNQ